LRLWKQKKWRADRNAERILKRLTDENGLSESQLINLLLLEKDEQTRLLSPEQKELQRDIDQLEARKRAIGPYEQAKTLDLTSPTNRARQARSDYHLTHKANPQQIEHESNEAQAVSMLEAGMDSYDIEKETGLSRKEIMALNYNRKLAEENKTRTALRERAEAIERGGYGPDELARRIGRLRRGLDPEGTDEEDPPSSLNVLNVEAIQRYIY